MGGRCQCDWMVPREQYETVCHENNKLRKAVEQLKPEPTDTHLFASFSPAQRMGYIESVLRWAACGYVNSPERVRQFRVAWKLVSELAETTVAAEDARGVDLLGALRDAEYAMRSNGMHCHATYQHVCRVLSEATPHPAPAVAEPQQTFPTGALNPEWMVGKTAGELRAMRHGDDPAVAAEAGQAFAWYRTVNGHRAGISFERCSPDIDGWEEHPLFTQPAPPSQGQWQPIETAPKDGRCLLAIKTDDGYEFGVLQRAANGAWVYEGEPTYCLSYYFEPTHWMPLPAAPTQPPAEGGAE